LAGITGTTKGGVIIKGLAGTIGGANGDGVVGVGNADRVVGVGDGDKVVGVGDGDRVVGVGDGDKVVGVGVGDGDRVDTGTKFVGEGVGVGVRSTGYTGHSAVSPQISSITSTVALNASSSNLGKE